MNVGTKGHIDHGCDLCGSKGLHACTGKPMTPWSLEEKNKLNDALCGIANREQINQYQRLVSVNGGRVFFKADSLDGSWNVTRTLMVDDGSMNPSEWTKHSLTLKTRPNMNYDGLSWCAMYINEFTHEDCQQFFETFKQFAR